jgi:hypothetical protein
MTVMTAALVLWASDTVTGFGVTVGVLALFPVLFMALSFKLSSSSKRVTAWELEQGWVQAVRELYAARSGKLSERELIEYGVSPDVAATWLAEAELGDFLSEDAPKLRVDAPRNTHDDELLAAEAEVELAEAKRADASDG